MSLKNKVRQVATVLTKHTKDGVLKQNPKLLEQAAGYMVEFSGLDAKDLQSHDKTKKVIKETQESLGVKADGNVGEVTIKAMMTIPRCGVSDVQFSRTELNAWARSKADGLSYKMVGYVNRISKEEQETTMMRAFEAWERVCGLRIIRTNKDSADIIISASASRREEFGQVGRVLAWAQLPQGKNWTGQLLMKFDLAENWGVDVDMGITGIHEIGHLLGLDHTQIEGQLMFPMYNSSVTEPQATYDIAEGVLRYGRPIVSTPPVPTPPAQPQTCADSVVVVIKGQKYGLTPKG